MKEFLKYSPWSIGLILFCAIWWAGVYHIGQKVSNLWEDQQTTKVKIKECKDALIEADALTDEIYRSISFDAEGDGN